VLEMLPQMSGWIVFGVLFFVGFLLGSFNERRHYRSIDAREKAAINTPAVTLGKSMVASEDWRESQLVMGSAVISIDYFKRVLASFVNLFGGRVANYETLVDRARREAVLRMREEAKGAHAIVNVRVETSSVGSSANRKNAIGSIEALAFGTALYN